LRASERGKTDDPGVGAFAALLGVHRTAMADGRSRFELDVRPGHHKQVNRALRRPLLVGKP
jgi:hypothetical protein